MATVIKADGVISNPKLGKIITLQLLTSESCVRSINTDLTGSTTDVYNGGSAYSWVGSAGQFALTSLGLTNEVTTATATTYLGMPLTKDVAVSYEAGEQGPGLIVDVRRLQTDNYCYRLNMSSTSFRIQRRAASDVVTTLATFAALSDGDKVYVYIKDGLITVVVNGSTVLELDDSSATDLQRAGTIAISKASTASGTHTYIRNLQVFALS